MNNNLRLSRGLLSLIPVILLLFVFVYFSGCDKLDELITPEDQDVTVEAAFARITTEVQTICSNVNVYLILIAADVTNIPGSCPEVTINTSAKSITVDYGSAGCISDSIKRSGRYTVSYTIISQHDSMTADINFNNYKVYRTQSDYNYVSITGTDNISSQKIAGNLYQSKYSISNNFSVSSGNAKSISLTMTANGNINNNLPMNGSFNINGNGTLTNISSGTTYSYLIEPSSSISYKTSCQYPALGLIYFDQGGYRFTIDLSPSNNNCDGIFSITKFGITKYSDLSVVDF